MDISEKVEKIKEMVQSIGDKTINIIISQVDPDAIGSALGLAYIIRVFGGKASIFYCGDISHPQNRALNNMYNLEKVIVPISSLTVNNDGVFALVDSFSGDDVRLGDLSGKIKPLIVIDHHRDDIDESNDSGFIWIDDVGSACTLIVELLQDILEKDEYKKIEQPSYLAPLLSLGIYNDTVSLIFACTRDEKAYSYISDSVSAEEFTRLVKFPLPKSFFLNLASAINNSTAKDGVLSTNVGIITPKQLDDLSMIADQLIQQADLTLVFVWGVVDDPSGKYIKFCARNDDITDPLNELLRAKFGDNSGAKLMPGGRGSGAGVINDFSLGSLDVLGAKDEIIALASKFMDSIIFDSQNI